MVERITLEQGEDGVRYLQRLLRYNAHPQFRQMVEDGPSVHAQYGRVFHPDNIHRLGSEEFKEFLLYEHNRHWWGIHRQQAKLVADMDRLRSTLATLVDETQPITRRLNWIEPMGHMKPMPGLGKAVITPILHVTYPDRYGVWNSVSEDAMTRLRLWPRFGWGSGFGEKYFAMNERLKDVASRLDIDLWTLDSLWWLTEQEHEPTKHQFEGGVSAHTRRSSTNTSRHTRPARTFVCQECVQVKSEVLRSPNTEVCIDCL